MSLKDKPAFLRPRSSKEGVQEDFKVTEQTGMNLRQYACIKLGVSESGNKELDDLIIKSNRKKYATILLQELITDPEMNKRVPIKDLVKKSFKVADEMIALEENESK